MSTQKAQKLLLETIGAQAGVVLCAILLTLPDQHPLADGLDQRGRSIFLVGRHALGTGLEAEQAVSLILQVMARGGYPDAVHPVLFAPKASEAIAAALDAPQDGEVLLHGPRGTGKTHALAATALLFAEQSLRHGYPSPLTVVWLHDSLLSASTKTGRSLQLPLWGGLWSLRDDARKAVCTLAGRVLVAGDFVGCKDEEAAQRLRLEVNLVLAEELVASMSDGTGIKEDQYDLARSSTLRLPTWKRLAMSATNPGGPETWPFVRFLSKTPRPKTAAIQIPATDRLTADEQAAYLQVFANAPTLHKRLTLGEWVMADQGVAVAEGFARALHVTTRPLVPHPNYLLAIGWDGGHSPSAVIGQQREGQVQVYAAMNSLSAGVLELIEAQLRPWLQTHAPWVLYNHGRDLVHIIDPNMATPGQATILESAERMIVQKLGGRVVRGPVRWPPRREAVLRVLAPRHEKGQIPLQIVDGIDTELLVGALEGRWYYPTHPTTGQVDRTGAKKPNSPWADVGDAAANLFGWLLGDDLMLLPTPGPIPVETAFSLDSQPIFR